MVRDWASSNGSESDLARHVLLLLWYNHVGVIDSGNPELLCGLFLWCSLCFEDYWLLIENEFASDIKLWEYE